MKPSVADKLAALEKRIEELGKQPKQEIHYHYMSYPQYIPQPLPYYIYPTYPTHTWSITCGASTTMIGTINAASAAGGSY